MEEDVVGYHASLRETSRLAKLQRPESRLQEDEDVLLEGKGRLEDAKGFDFGFREVGVYGRRTD
jgi:hypothetical protein